MKEKEGVKCVCYGFLESKITKLPFFLYLYIFPILIPTLKLNYEINYIQTYIFSPTIILSMP